MMQGGSAVSKDLPPFTIVRAVNHLAGLNFIGLRRAGYTTAQRLELKQLYRQLLRRHGPISVALAEAQKLFTSAPARTLIDFVAASKRGVCVDTGDAGAVEGDID